LESLVLQVAALMPGEPRWFRQGEAEGSDADEVVGKECGDRVDLGVPFCGDPAGEKVVDRVHALSSRSTSRARLMACVPRVPAAPMLSRVHRPAETATRSAR